MNGTFTVKEKSERMASESPDTTNKTYGGSGNHSLPPEKHMLIDLHIPDCSRSIRRSIEGLKDAIRTGHSFFSAIGHEIRRSELQMNAARDNARNNLDVEIGIQPCLHDSCPST